MGGLPTDGSGVLPQLPSIPLLPGGSEGPSGPRLPGLPGDADAAAESGPPSHLVSDMADDPPTSLLGPGAAADVPGTIAPSDGSPSPGTAPGSPASGGSGSGGAGAGAGGASGTSDAAFAALGLDALASMVLRSVDDELPSSPVYDTDTTPD